MDTSEEPRSSNLGEGSPDSPLGCSPLDPVEGFPSDWYVDAQARKDSLTISETGDSNDAADTSGHGDAPLPVEVKETTLPERTPEPIEEVSPTEQRDEAGPVNFELSRQVSGESDDAQGSMPGFLMDDSHSDTWQTADEQGVTVVWQADPALSPRAEAEQPDVGQDQSPIAGGKLSSEPALFSMCSEDSEDSDFGVSKGSIGNAGQNDFDADPDDPPRSAAVGLKSGSNSSCASPVWTEPASTRSLSDGIAAESGAVELPVRGRVSLPTETSSPLPTLSLPVLNSPVHANEAQSFAIPARSLGGTQTRSSWETMLHGNSVPKTPSFTSDEEIMADSPPPLSWQMPSSSFHSATGSFHCVAQVRRPHTFCASDSTQTSRTARGGPGPMWHQRIWAKLVGPMPFCTHSCHVVDEE